MGRRKGSQKQGDNKAQAEHHQETAKALPPKPKATLKTNQNENPAPQGGAQATSKPKAPAEENPAPQGGAQATSKPKAAAEENPAPQGGAQATSKPKAAAELLQQLHQEANELGIPSENFEAFMVFRLQKEKEIDMEKKERQMELEKEMVRKELEKEILRKELVKEMEKMELAKVKDMEKMELAKVKDMEIQKNQIQMKNAAECIEAYLKSEISFFTQRTILERFLRQAWGLMGYMSPAEWKLVLKSFPHWAHTEKLDPSFNDIERALRLPVCNGILNQLLGGSAALPKLRHRDLLYGNLSYPVHHLKFRVVFISDKELDDDVKAFMVTLANLYGQRVEIVDMYKASRGEQLVDF